VDDILIASANKEEIRKLKESLNTKFEMKDLGSARRILGLIFIGIGQKVNYSCPKEITSRKWWKGL